MLGFYFKIINVIRIHTPSLPIRNSPGTNNSNCSISRLRRWAVLIGIKRRVPIQEADGNSNNVNSNNNDKERSTWKSV